MTFFNPKHESWIYKLYKQKAMKTAMQELLSEMSNPNWDRLSFDARYEMFDKLLDLEKEQLLSEWQKGFDDAKYIYEQTYNQSFQKSQEEIDRWNLMHDIGEGKFIK